MATWSNAWVHPNQSDGWQTVSIAKLGSWLLLMIVSVALVTWLEKPRPPEVPEATLTPKDWGCDLIR